MEKYFFISDIHIGAGTEDTEHSKINKLFSFLNYIDDPQNKLFIVGDLFDFWFEYKHAIPKNYFSIFYRLHKLIQNGVEIHFLPGNHDYWIVDFFENELGFIVHPDVLQLETQSKKLFLFHGDGILKRDKGYRFLKRVFRNPINIKLYRWLHPDLGIPLAKLTSHTSRQHINQHVIHAEEDYIDFASNKFNEGFDIVIIGHSHQPLIKNIDGKYLINLGDWLYHYTYGLLENGELSLNYWEQNKKK